MQLRGQKLITTEEVLSNKINETQGSRAFRRGLFSGGFTIKD